jgi:poly-gamma-glutamate synthesis protein (capsule biosynthesis protein)
VGVRWLGLCVLATLVACASPGSVVVLGTVTRTTPGTSAPETSPASVLAGPTTSSGPTTTSPRHASLLFTGDTIVHTQVLAAATTTRGVDFAPMLAPVAPMISNADLAVCHLETTLGLPGQSYHDYPQFRAPPELAQAIADAGFDGCSTASNHAIDFGLRGVSATSAMMEANHLQHTGTAANPEASGAPARYSANGISVAQLSYTYGSNGAIPAKVAWMLNVIDPARILADAVLARSRGAEIVVVSLHWGSEYVHEITAAQRKVAAALAAQPGVIDLVVGSHAHVVEPISQIGSMWVAWGMGNFLTDNSHASSPNDEADGVMVRVTVGDRSGGGVGVTQISVTPTWNERRHFRVIPIASALGSGETFGVSPALLRASFERTMRFINAAATTPIEADTPLP